MAFPWTGFTNSPVTRAIWWPFCLTTIGSHHMDEYIFSADLLNKFSQLTPWVQAFIGLGACGVFLGFFYFFKESITAIMKPFYKRQDEEPKEEKREWKDKYYREEEK